MNCTVDLKCLCGKICHENCDLGFDQNIIECECFDGDTCRICGHHESLHSYFGWIKIMYEEDVIKIDDLKK